MEKGSIAFILPLYDKYIYGRRAALSFFKYTPEAKMCIILDDASSYYPKQDWNAWFHGMPRERCFFYHYEENGGLTRSWNEGLRTARQLECEYTICGNSDVLFTKGWSEGLVYAIRNGWHLVAPVTNAPGHTNRGRQRVHHFYPAYQVDYEPDYLNGVAAHIRNTQALGTVHEDDINGFFMMAKTETWWEGAFDKDHVFDPSKKMTGNEDELQRRWKAKGWKIGFVPRSFIFHYRAVSRGDAHKHGGWARHAKDDMGNPV